MAYIAAIDQGTTSTRCILFDETGRIVALDQREHDQLYPKPGWVEHDAKQILSRTESVVMGALAAARIEPRALAAVGITNQRETTVVWDRHTGEPICPAIVWQDTRTAELCSSLAETSGRERFRDWTGLPISTYFSGPKLAWILEHVPGARARAEKGELFFGTMDTWLVWNLTGEHVTDVTNASRTLLFNIRTLEWDSRLLEAMNIPSSMLPRVISSSERIGVGKGILAGVPFAGILGDQQAALFGQACFSPGEAKCTFGTGCFVLLNLGTTPTTSLSGLLTTVAYRLGKAATVYALEGSVAIAGAAIQWLRDSLGIIASARESEVLARTVEDHGGVYFVPAFNGLFAPYWRDDVRGLITGLTRFAHRGHIARAALEASAYQVRAVLDAMYDDSGVRLSRLKVDGGMIENELLMQFQADILGQCVERPIVAETTALGAAYAAGLAVGYYPDLETLRKNWCSERVFAPQMNPSRRVELYSGWRRAVRQAMYSEARGTTAE